MRGSDASLEKRIRESRQRRDDVYRRLGEHVKGCEACSLADSLDRPPAPFCLAGDRLVGELAHARFDLHMAVTRLMNPELVEQPAPVSPGLANQLVHDYRLLALADRARIGIEERDQAIGGLLAGEGLAPAADLLWVFPGLGTRPNCSPGDRLTA